MVKYHSDYSLLTSAAPISKTLIEAKVLGHEAAGITDYKTLAGIIPFLNNCLKESIKPILGLQGNNCLLYAKNTEGYHNLCMTLNNKKIHAANLIAVTGYLHSDLYNLTFKEHKLTDVVNYGEASALLNDDAEQLLKEKIQQYRGIFKTDFYIGLQKIYECFPTVQLLNEILENLANRYDVDIIYLDDIHYIKPTDSVLQRVVLSEKHKVKLSELENSLAGDELRFMLTNKAYVQPASYFKNAAFDKFVNSIEEYQLKKFPKMEPFCENDFAKFDELLDRGKAKVQNWNDKYESRLQEEVALMKSFEILVTYFLVVADYCNWAKEQGMRIGERGSAAGCLITYLLGVTGLDPLEYDLLFSRFFNEGRIKKDGVALPDIDVDFPKFRRQEVQDYVINKYGRGRVAYMRTFSRYKGKEALKAIFRVYDSVNSKTADKITKLIFSNDKISDKLEEMSKARGHASAIIWSLENNSPLAEYCTVKYDDQNNKYEFAGNLSFYFQKAVELEGVIRQKGQHASGLAICHELLAKHCELEEESGRIVVNIEMNELESLGIPKLDILGNLSLDKIMAAEDSIRGVA